MRKILMWSVVGVAFCGSLAFGYSGGSGTEPDPYQIANKQDLLELGANTNHYDKHFVMTADIDLSGEVFTKAVIASDDALEDDFQGSSFHGVFNGNGHVIHNLTIEGNDYLGLFGQISGYSRVSDLGIEGLRISGGSEASCLGGVSGRLGNGTISGCYVTGSISSGWSSSSVGGIVGYNYFGTINQCYSTVTISGEDRAGLLGGLCGYNYYGDIRYCYSTGSVSGKYDSVYIGGLCGKSESATFRDCYATGAVSGGDESGFVGGFCGYFTGRYSSGDVRNCYSMGLVSGGAGSSLIGGFCGGNDSTVNACFWDVQTSGMLTSGGGSGKTTVEMKMRRTFTDAGWDFVGETPSGTEDIWVLNEYPLLAWAVDFDTDGDGLSDFWEMEYFETLARDGSGDFDDDTLIDMDESAAGTNPALADTDGDGASDGVEVANGSNPLVYDLPGTGSGADPYRIENREGFNAFCRYDRYWGTDVHTRLEIDIDLAGTTFSTAPVASDIDPSNTSFDGAPFRGIFDGKDHVVRNLTIDTAGLFNDYLGFFGRIEGVGALVRNLGVEGVHITGSEGDIFDDVSDYLGGVCGETYWGTISNCYATGTVSAGAFSSLLGGLCGSSEYGTLMDSHSLAIVSGGRNSSSIGGLCGENHGGLMQGCYSAGAVFGYASRNMGGLCGENLHGGRIWECSALGAVSNQYAGSSLGGLCGRNRNDSEISSCYASGAVSAGGLSSSLGGLCGENFYASISNCYSIGAVSCDADSYGIGGFCGKNDEGDISASYASGFISSGTGTTDVGGFCGDCYWVPENIKFSFWDKQTSGTIVSGGGEGKTTVEMQTESTFVSAGWDFNNTWSMSLYPVLRKALPRSRLIVNSGSGDGAYVEGERISIIADPAEVGTVFNRWSGDIDFVENVNLRSTVVTMPDHDVLITAIYENIPEWIVSVQIPQSGGSIIPAGDITVYQGESQTFVATPDSGYKFKHWLVDGEITEVGQKELTLNNITSDMIVEAFFEKIKAMPWLNLLLE